VHELATIESDELRSRMQIMSVAVDAWKACVSAVESDGMNGVRDVRKRNEHCPSRKISQVMIEITEAATRFKRLSAATFFISLFLNSSLRMLNSSSLPFPCKVTSSASDNSFDPQLTPKSQPKALWSSKTSLLLKCYRCKCH